MGAPNASTVAKILLFFSLWYCAEALSLGRKPWKRTAGLWHKRSLTYSDKSDVELSQEALWDLHAFDSCLSGSKNSAADLFRPPLARTRWNKEDVRQHWLNSVHLATTTSGCKKPPRIGVSFSDAGTLVLEVAPLMRESKLAVAAPGLMFSAAWLAIVVDLSFKFLRTRSILGMLLLLPFWYAGVTTAVYAMDEARRSTSTLVISIGEFEWSVSEVEATQRRSRLFQTALTRTDGVLIGSGATERLTGVHVAARHRVDQESTEEPDKFVVSTEEGVGPTFQSRLSSQESRWLASALENFIGEVTKTSS